ncbi:MAG: hypothetical protein WD005_04465 [Haliea sp.]
MYTDGHLRSLQRRVREWRRQMALHLVFGERITDGVFPKSDHEEKITDAMKQPLGNIPDEATRPAKVIVVQYSKGG